MEKWGRQKVSVKLFFCSKTQAKIIARHGLASKIFAIGVKPALKSSFDHFDRSTLPPFDTQRISKSSSNFFEDVPSPPCQCKTFSRIGDQESAISEHVIKFTVKTIIELLLCAYKKFKLFLSLLTAYCYS